MNYCIFRFYIIDRIIFRNVYDREGFIFSYCNFCYFVCFGDYDFVGGSSGNLLVF